MADPIQLTPAEQAEYENAAASSVAAINPIRDFSADELFDLSIKDKENFDLGAEFRRNKDLWKDAATVAKVKDVYGRIADRGFELSDIPGPGKIAKTVGGIIKGGAKQIWNYATAGVNTAMAMAGDLTGQGPAFSTELTQDAQRRVMENIAGTEAATFGAAQLVGKGVRKARRALSDMTQDEKDAEFWDYIGAGETEEEILKGKGGLLEPVGGTVRTELEAAGKPIRPEETQALAAGDPLSFFLYGKAFGGIGKGVRAGAAKVAERLPAKAAAALEKAPAVAEVTGGRVIQAAGTLTDLGGRAVRIFGPAVGMVKGAIEAGPVGALAGLKAGEIAAKVGGKISKGGKALIETGKEIAGAAPVIGGATQLAKDVIGGAPIAVSEVGKGLAFDIGTAALTAETPRDTESVGIGAFFGGLGAAQRVGGRVISGQLVGPRAWGADKAVASSGQVPALDAVHNTAVESAAPAIKTRVNAIREFLKGSNTDADFFLLPRDPAAAEQALVTIGLTPEQAKSFSQQAGFFTARFTGTDGKQRGLLLARDIDAAPHEAFHAIQDVLGETANQHIDQIVREEYGPQWENEGRRYAARIGPGDWREVVLDSTGTGLNYAKEKIAIDVANEYRAATGAEPPPGYVAQRAKEVFGQAMDAAVQANPNVSPNEISSRVWRDILSPQEVQAVADSYLARELAAENFDMVFKHGGPDLRNQSGLTGRLARIVAQLVSTLGGEPLSPERPSQIGEIAPRFRVTEAVRQAPGLVQPRETISPKQDISPIGKTPPTSEPVPPTSPPAEPTEQNVTEARTIAESAPTTTIVAGTASPREILGQVAEAIAQRAGLKVNYLSAEGEGPAASISSNRDARRAVIEAFRTMPPEARALWEKNFFPDRVIKTKDKYQILGWAPEVFASNAHKLAAKLQELGVADSSPYPVAEGTFTPEGWQSLYNDVQTFVKNQMGGRTGSGEGLVVPRDITERGFYVPQVRGQAEGLPQIKADFISMLFGIKLPDTGRIQKGRLPLNIAGQAISEATLPGRTEIPVIPRGRFEGAEAQRQGIEGQEIKEVNPLRQQIEAAAQSKGVAMPEFIEAQQRLNLENIKNVEVAGELPEFRGNVLTLTAGFQPRSEEPRAIRAAAVRFPSGKVYEGYVHSDAIDTGLKSEPVKGIQSFQGLDNLSDQDFMSFRESLTDGFTTNEGKFLNRDEAFSRARELEQLDLTRMSDVQELFYGPDVKKGELEAYDFRELNQFQPSSNPRAIRAAVVRDENGRVWEGMFHGIAENRARQMGSEGPFEEGFITNAGEFLDRNDAYARAKEFDQLAPEAVSARENKYGLEASRVKGSEADVFMKTRFQPSSAPRAIDRLAVKDEKTGKIFRGELGDIHYSVSQRAKESGSKLKDLTDGYVTNEGEFLDRDAAFQRATELKQLSETAALKKEAALGYGLESVAFTELRRFQPERQVKDIAAMTPDDFRKWAEGLSKTGGFTEVAHKVGLDAPSQEFVNTLPIAQKAFSAKAEDAMKAGDFETAMVLASQSQFFREAWEAATGEGSAGYFFRKEQPGYQPKFPLDKAPEVSETPVAMQPSKFDDSVRKVAKEYAKESGLPYVPPTGYVRYDRDLAKRIAKAFEDAQHSPDDPEVRASYDAFRQEVLDQYKAIETAGYDLEPVVSVESPYRSGADVARDIRQNKHLFFNLSESAFGPEGSEISKSGLMLEPSGVTLHGKELTINDLFRAIHDFFGHAHGGVSFGPRGEFNAWREHSALFSDEAQGALAAETIGQTAWTQLGPHLLGKTGELLKPGEEGFTPRPSRPYAEQKNFVLPKELIEEAKGVQFQPQPKKELKLKPPKAGFSKTWVLPDGKIVNIGGQWHHDYLNDNPEIRARYGLPDDDSQDNRIGALNKGFVRMSWDVRNGMLVVESRTRDWPKQRDAVRNFIEANAGDIDRIGVTLLSGKDLDTVDDYAEVKVFQLEDNEKAAMLPFSDVADKRETGVASDRMFERAVEKFGVRPRSYGELLAESEEVFPPPQDSDPIEYARSVSQAIDSWMEQNKKQEDDRISDKNRKEIETLIAQLQPEPPEGESVRQQLDRRFRQRARGGRAFFAAAKISPVEIELKKIQSGESFGQTFTKEGDVWQPEADKPVDIVTVASVNVPTKDLTPEKYDEVTAQYKELLDDPNVVAGVFKLDDNTSSIDINAVVPQTHRENTAAFAKGNNQKSIWDAAKQEVVETGGTGDTTLKSIAQIKDAIQRLAQGEPVDFNAQLQPSRDVDLFGTGAAKKHLSSREVSNMTLDQLRDYYPEAVIPKTAKEPIPSKITESPLFKQSGDEETAVKAFGDKLAEFYKSVESDPMTKAGAEWYEKFTPRLEKEFGDDAQLFAEMLAATSPQTGVAENFRYSVSAVESLKAGRFKKIIPKFEEGLEKIADGSWKSWYERELPNIPKPPAKPTTAAFLGHWIHKYDLKPRQPSGKLYGTHSKAILQVLTRNWLNSARGPKTLNFVENLVGKSDEATIDLWADRTMRRIGYDGDERWRILPKNVMGVSDKDFKFAQKAFRHAAEKVGIKPSALQGALWFAEKRLWGDKGWTRLDFGDFRTEMKKLPAIREEFSRLTGAKKGANIKQMKIAMQPGRPKALKVKAGVKSKDYNSNNAWGFGGMTGKEYEFPNGYRLRKGQAHFRHLPSEAAQYGLDPDGKRVSIDELREKVSEWLD